MAVERVELVNFRGVTTRTPVDFALRGAAAQTVFIIGDNGAGKSSVVDAIEFGLRGRLSRRGAFGQKHKREVQNMNSGGAPGVLVVVDGTRVRRGGGIKDAVGHAVDSAVTGFDLCPLIIRRQDVESFRSVPASERQALFFDYLRPPGTPSLDRIRLDLQGRIQEETRKRDSGRRRLASLVGSHVQLPTRHNQTRTLLNKVLLPRFGTGKHPNRKIPAPMFAAFQEMQNALQRLEALEPQLRNLDAEDDALAQMRGILASIAERVSDDFARVGGKDWVSRVAIESGAGSELGIRLVLSNGHDADPTQVLNEAALDLLALLILVEVHVACAELGQRRVIVLDDVFQSVDSVNRVRALDHVLARLTGWQLFMTVHDRLWLELARSQATRTGRTGHLVVEVLSGSGGGPPEIRRAGSGPAVQLEELLERGDQVELTVAFAGRALEQLSDRLSISLQTSVTRRAGDKYTLGDLWPGVLSKLKKSGAIDFEVLEDVDRHLSLRNIAGAHYNEWADALSRAEGDSFARAVLKLWQAVSCPQCGSSLSVFRAAQGNRVPVELPCNCSPDLVP